MHSAPIDQVLADLRTPDVAKQVPALEDFFSSVYDGISDSDKREVLMATLSAFESSSDRFLIGPWIPRFGDEAVIPLENLFTHTSIPEVRILSALLLLPMGSSVGVSVIVQEVESNGTYRIIAAYALTKAGVTDHVPAMIDALRQFEVITSHEFPATEDDDVLHLLELLGRLRVALPNDIRRKLADLSAPQFFQKAIQSYDVAEKTGHH